MCMLYKKEFTLAYNAAYSNSFLVMILPGRVENERWVHWKSPLIIGPKVIILRPHPALWEGNQGKIPFCKLWGHPGGIIKAENDCV